MGEAARRWRQLVRARMAEMERLQPGASPLANPAFWDRRARRFAAGPMRSAEGDPLLSRLRRAVTPARSLLDVGSGPGRFSLALAPRARSVVAVDPSRRMLAILRREAREANLGNIRTVTGAWEDVDVEPADIVLCSYVLPLIAEAGPFLTKLDRSARHRVFLYLGAFASDAMADPFWRHFHGAPRRPGPSYLDAVAVLDELGIRPDVEVVEVTVRTRHPTLEAAVENYRDALVLAKTPAVRRELARLLEPWLQAADGGLRPPFRSHPAAVLSWSPAGAGR
ncbi:MAG: class I SAM-dependent methyltransferase [Acidimicrobiales bacterium]